MFVAESDAAAGRESCLPPCGPAAARPPSVHASLWPMCLVAAAGGQGWQAGQYLAWGIWASLVAVMARPHCWHQPNRPAASRASAASVSVDPL
jgi:hypothetical protein